jgi:hypothetical protein
MNDMKKMILTAAALATLIGIASTGAMAQEELARPPAGIIPAEPNTKGLEILKDKTGNVGLTYTALEPAPADPKLAAPIELAPQAQIAPAGVSFVQNVRNAWDATVAYAVDVYEKVILSVK